jgi:hypothetical protein
MHVATINMYKSGLKRKILESLGTDFLHLFLAVFWHMVFVDGFLISVKELGLLTNPGQWIRGLDVAGSYIYIVL